MRTAGHVYHINCFACVVCECRLEKGQEFALKDNKLYCKEHFTQLSNINNIKQESKCLLKNLDDNSGNTLLFHQ